MLPFLKMTKLMWRLWTNPLLSIWIFCLGRGTGVGGSMCISVLLKSISPVVSRFFAITEQKHSSMPVDQNATGFKCYYFIVSFFLLSQLNWNKIPVTVAISFGPGRELFTFLVKQLIPTSSSCTHMAVSFSGRPLLGRVQALWRNGWPFDRRTSHPSFSLDPWNPVKTLLKRVWRV